MSPHDIFMQKITVRGEQKVAVQGLTGTGKWWINEHLATRAGDLVRGFIVVSVEGAEEIAELARNDEVKVMFD
jgi:hypothetical protein